MKSVGIVGFGYVGKAMANFFKDHYEVIVYDPYILAENHFFRGVDKEAINYCDVAVVCVPTPQGNDGSCDTSIVEDVFDWLTCPLAIVKSTIPPGTTEYLQKKCPDVGVVFSPEYCGESTYWSPYAFHKDVKETPFFVFGGLPEHTTRAVDLFLPITGPCKTYRQTSPEVAEMAKYVENTFYATKIGFCYEIAEICASQGIDFNEVRETWLLDPRINPMHTAVFKGDRRAFGGKCLPKDLSALIESSLAHGYSPNLLEEIQRTNDRIGEIRGDNDRFDKENR